MKLKVAAGLDAIWRMFGWMWNSSILPAILVLTGMWLFITLMIWGTVLGPFWAVFGPSLLIYAGVLVLFFIGLAIYGVLKWGHITMDSVRRDERNWHK